MRFIKNEACPEDSDYLEGLVSNHIEENISIYRLPSDGSVKYLLLSVRHMLNLLYECQGETEEAIINFGKTILEAALATKNHCSTKDLDRAKVRGLCIGDHYGQLDFSLENANTVEMHGCVLYHDTVNDTWTIYIDQVELYRFNVESRAREVFEYVKRDIRQSSDKWLCAIDGIPSRF